MEALSPGGAGPVSEFAGTLNQRIEIWSRSTVRLASGALSDDMSLLLTCLASVSSDGAGVPTDAMSVSAMPRFRVTVRARTEFAVDQQVRWKGRRLAVRQLIDDPKLPDRMCLHCEERR